MFLYRTRKNEKNISTAFWILFIQKSWLPKVALSNFMLSFASLYVFYVYINERNAFIRMLLSDVYKESVYMALDTSYICGVHRKRERDHIVEIPNKGKWEKKERQQQQKFQTTKNIGRVYTEEKSKKNCIHARHSRTSEWTSECETASTVERWWTGPREYVHIDI